MDKSKRSLVGIGFAACATIGFITGVYGSMLDEQRRHKHMGWSIQWHEDK